MKHHIFVLHDSIQNSVFHGQVLQPLLEKLSADPTLHITLISFEKSSSTRLRMKLRSGTEKIIPYKKRLNVLILKKLPFLGTATLYPSVWQLKKILKKIPTYTLTARGPIAGWICTKAIQKKQCTYFVVQARGLLAEEYRYVNQQGTSLFKKLVHAVRAKQFESVEKSVYKNKNIHIEAVSYDLRDYLVKRFGSKKQNITVVENLPEQYEASKINSWKKEIRKELNIAQDAHVYCFNGALKPWQCPEMVVGFFSKQLKKNKNIFLLVITQNKKEFETLLSTYNFSSKNYVVLTVAHHDVYKYLAACDTGLIFRTPHIINWVSRPTKALEYHAVGLNIIHNNTVGWIARTVK